MKDLQLYTDKAVVEPEGTRVLLVTLAGVDLSELVGQVSIDDLADNWDVSDIQDYLTRRVEADKD